LHRAQRGFPVVRLERFRAKRVPVRVKKTRQDKNLASPDIEAPFPAREAAPPVSSDRLRELHLSLRQARNADRSFLLALFASFRAEEMERIPWPQDRKDAFLADQFRLQHHHFVSYFSGADFWIVERSLPSAPPLPVGRFYIDRSTLLWRVVDIGFLPSARGQGLGSALLRWAQTQAADAGAAGIDLHVLITNLRAEKLYRTLGFRAQESAEGHHQRMEWRAPILT
jgi:GNAT superfamily N-acetyltransferase